MISAPVRYATAECTTLAACDVGLPQMYVGLRYLLVANDYETAVSVEIVFRVSKGLLAVGCEGGGNLSVYDISRSVAGFTVKLTVRCCQLRFAVVSGAASCPPFPSVLKNL